jgi:hypothetical protein
MTDETINQQLALNGIISQKTLLSNLGYDYATEKKNKEEETDILYETVSPDTQFVSPNDVDKAQTNEKTTTTSTTASQTNNQIAQKTKNQLSTKKSVPNRTDNIKPIRSREGRPNK